MERKDKEIRMLRESLEEGRDSIVQMDTTLGSRNEAKIKEAIRSRVNSLISKIAGRKLNREWLNDELQECAIDLEDLIDNPRTTKEFSGKKSVMSSKSYRNIGFSSEKPDFGSTIKQNLIRGSRLSTGGNQTPKQTVKQPRVSNPFPNYFSAAKEDEGRISKTRFKLDKN